MTDALQNAITGIVATLAAWAWLGRNVAQDDADTETCHEYVLSALSDADLVGKIDCAADADLRSQLTVEQALELAQEAELARMGARRN